jgi:hypothetical protein
MGKTKVQVDEADIMLKCILNVIEREGIDCALADLCSLLVVVTDGAEFLNGQLDIDEFIDEFANKTKVVYRAMEEENV